MSPRRRKPVALIRPEGGFTLVEIIITLAVFGVGVLALAAVIPLGIKRNNSATQQSRASELAAGCAERLLDTPFVEPDLSAGNHKDANNPYAGRYYIQWTVEDDQPIKSCKRITVVVNAPDAASPAAARLIVVSSEAGS